MPKRARQPELKLDPKNARHHGKRNKDLIRQSLEEIGGFRSIGVDGNNVVRAGNGVFEQAQALGLKVRVIDAKPDELIAVRRPDLKGQRAIRAAILDNRAGELSEWDTGILAEMPDDVVAGLWTDDEWAEFGIDTGLSDQIETADVEALVDRAEVLRKKWRVEPGQLWEIPSLTAKKKAHRLLCGDSTDQPTVERLMAGKRAVLFSTDPPYLVDYDGTNHPHKWNEPDKNKDWSEEYKDWDNSEQGEALYDGFITVAKQVAIVENAAWYCWHASVRQAMVESVWIKHGAFVHQQIIWTKDRPVLTRSWYLWQHEPCFFGWVRGKKPKRVAEDYPSTTWPFPTLPPGKQSDHPTQKPVELFAIPMLQHTHPGDLCYEPFSGSGSQFVAAEQNGRVCYGLDKQPQFVAVALERLAELGLKPQLLGETETKKKPGKRPGSSKKVKRG